MYIAEVGGTQKETILEPEAKVDDILLTHAEHAIEANVMLH